MKICQDCNRELVWEAKFCTGCGGQNFAADAPQSLEDDRSDRVYAMIADAFADDDDDEYADDEYDEFDRYADEYDVPQYSRGARARRPHKTGGLPIWSKSTLLGIAASLLLSGIIFLIIFIVGLTRGDVPEEARAWVPDVEGVPLDTAAAWLESAGLRHSVVETRYSDVLPQGYVLQQDIFADTPVAINTTLALVVSSGPDMRVMPFVEGLQVAQASAVLHDIGLAARYVYENSAAFAEGAVIGQYPPAGHMTDAGSAAILRISAGPADAPPRRVAYIPNVNALDLHEAARVAHAMGFAVEAATRLYNNAPAGTVLSQDPAPGSQQLTGSVLRLEISAGEYLRALPMLQYMPRARAEYLLEAAGFSFSTSSAQSDYVAAGGIISQSPAGGSLAAHGSHVSLVVSAGPAPAQMPDVTAMDAGQARDALHGAGLVIAAVYTHDDAPQNTVARQDPPPQAAVTPGGLVTIYISTNAQIAQIPPLAGLDYARAADTLAQDGFGIAQVHNIHSRAAPAGAIIGQFPAAGSLRPAGGQVVIVVSEGPRSIFVPAAIVGQPWQAAAQMLYGEGWQVSIAHEFNQTTPPGHVIRTSAVQSEAFAGDSITVFVSNGPQHTQAAVPPPAPPPPPPAQRNHGITYNPNGAPGVAHTHFYEDGAVHIIGPAIFSRAGYVFVQWNTQADGTGTHYAPGDIIPALDADIALFAIWSADVVAVANILGIPGGAPAGVALELDPTIVPQNATNQTIVWTVQSAGTTGALITGAVLNTTAPGTAVIRATIVGGAGAGLDFTADFTIDFSESHIAVGDISGLPLTANVGIPLILSPTVVPWYATHQQITWHVVAPGTTGAQIVGSTLTAQHTGQITIRATIANGLAPGMPFLREFQISVVDAFVPVTRVELQSQNMTAGVPFVLMPQIFPYNATGQTIQWAVTNAAFSNAIIEGSVLHVQAPDIVTITATVPFGTSRTENFTQDFEIVVHAAPETPPPHVPVTGILPIFAMSMPAGGLLPLGGVVEPPAATNRAIYWSIINDGGDAQAHITGDALHAFVPGRISIMASIPGGTAPGVDFTAWFTIEVLGDLGD